MTATITNIFTTQGFAGFIQFLLIILMIIYVLYSFISLRQVSLMNKSFSTPLAGLFSLLAVVNLVFAILLTAITIVTA
jgi:flagellar biosynthesis protein FlhB